MDLLQTAIKALKGLFTGQVKENADTEGRPVIPSDAEKRSWVVANPPAGTNPAEKEGIITLLAGTDDRQLHILGTAFVVGGNGNRAVCICAAHSLEHVKRLENASQQGTYWYAPPDLVGGQVEYLPTERIHAFVLVGEELVRCEVDQLNYIGGNDLALVTVVAPETHKFNVKFGLDFAVPKVGTEVMALCNKIDQDGGEDGRGQLALEFHARVGIVTSVEFGAALPGQSSIFYSTIPTVGGMSGSPVIAVGKDGEPTRVVGVISSDLSPVEAFSSFMVPGRSAISMLWPVFGLGIDGLAEGASEPTYHPFADLVAIGFIDNQTTAARVNVEQRRSRTKILYSDAVHGNILLESTGNPKAPN